MNTLTNRVVELNEAGLTIAKIRATLTLEDYAAKDITAAIKDASISAVKVGFASEFYAFIAEELRTTEEATAYIMGTDGEKETSKNVKKHLSHYLAIHELSVTIWNA